VAEHCLGSSFLKGTPQVENALAIFDFSQTGIARPQNDQLSPLQIQVIASYAVRIADQRPQGGYHDATKESIQQVKAPKILHIATHAFFLPDEVARVRGALLQLPPGFEDPMLRSGLFFAGANRVLRGEKVSKDLEDGRGTYSCSM